MNECFRDLCTRSHLSVWCVYVYVYDDVLFMQCETLTPKKTHMQPKTMQKEQKKKGAW